jgi:hypothetical protein
MKIYMVIYGDDWQAGYWVLGVFSTRDIAQQAIHSHFTPDQQEYFGVHIDEYSIDDIVDEYPLKGNP